MHVSDVVRAAILAAFCTERKQSVFNVTGGAQHTLSEAAALIRELLPDADVRIAAGAWHLDRQGPWDFTAAERDLDYRPAYTLERGLAEYVEWLRENAY